MTLLSRHTFSKQEDAEEASSPKAVSKEEVAAAVVLTQTMMSETCGCIEHKWQSIHDALQLLALLASHL